VRADNAASEHLRALMDEWRATAEVGWSRPLSIEEARLVLRALAEGWDSPTTAEYERTRRISRG